MGGLAGLSFEVRFLFLEASDDVDQRYNDEDKWPIINLVILEDEGHEEADELEHLFMELLLIR